MKNKIVVISLIFSLFIGMFLNISYAGYSEGDMPELTFDTTGYDTSKYFLVNNQAGVFIFMLPNDFTGNVIYENGDIWLSDGNSYLICQIVKDVWCNRAITNRTNGNYSIYYSTLDIYNNSGDVVFRKPPVTTLAEVLTLEEGRKTIVEIVGLLPLILVVVVSFLGLRKALNWLLTLLRHS